MPDAIGNNIKFIDLAIDYAVIGSNPHSWIDPFDECDDSVSLLSKHECCCRYTALFLSINFRVVATVIGISYFLRITLFTNQLVNKNIHTCFYVHLALQ